MKRCPVCKAVISDLDSLLLETKQVQLDEAVEVLRDIRLVTSLSDMNQFKDEPWVKKVKAFLSKIESEKK